MTRKVRIGNDTDKLNELVQSGKRDISRADGMASFSGEDAITRAFNSLIRNAILNRIRFGEGFAYRTRDGKIEAQAFLAGSEAGGGNQLDQLGSDTFDDLHIPPRRKQRPPHIYPAVVLPIQVVQASRLEAETLATLTYVHAIERGILWSHGAYVYAVRKDGKGRLKSVASYVKAIIANDSLIGSSLNHIFEPIYGVSRLVSASDGRVFIAITISDALIGSSVFDEHRAIYENDALIAKPLVEYSIAAKRQVPARSNLVGRSVAEYVETGVVRPNLESRLRGKDRTIRKRRFILTFDDSLIASDVDEYLAFGTYPLPVESRLVGKSTEIHPASGLVLKVPESRLIGSDEATYTLGGKYPLPARSKLRGKTIQIHPASGTRPLSAESRLIGSDDEIREWTLIPTVTLAASQPAAMKLGPVNGTFTFARSGGDIGSQLRVFFSVSGDAIEGTEYASLPSSIVFPAGDSTYDLDITPIQSSISSAWEKYVTVTILDSALYDLGISIYDTVNINCDLITNGDFEDGNAGWTINNTKWRQLNSGGNPSGRIEYDVAIADVGDVALTNIPTVVNGQYIINFDQMTSILTNRTIQIQSAIGFVTESAYSGSFTSTESDNQWYPKAPSFYDLDTSTPHQYFIANSTASTLAIRGYSITTTGRRIVSVDNVKCRRIG